MGLRPAAPQTAVSANSTTRAIFRFLLVTYAGLKVRFDWKRLAAVTFSLSGWATAANESQSPARDFVLVPSGLYVSALIYVRSVSTSAGSRLGTSGKMPQRVEHIDRDDVQHCVFVV